MRVGLSCGGRRHRERKKRNPRQMPCPFRPRAMRVGLSCGGRRQGPQPAPKTAKETKIPKIESLRLFCLLPRHWESGVESVVGAKAPKPNPREKKNGTGSMPELCVLHSLGEKRLESPKGKKMVLEKKKWYWIYA